MLLDTGQICLRGFFSVDGSEGFDGHVVSIRLSDGPQMKMKIGVGCSVASNWVTGPLKSLPGTLAWSRYVGLIEQEAA